MEGFWKRVARPCEPRQNQKDALDSLPSGLLRGKVRRALPLVVAIGIRWRQFKLDLTTRFVAMGIQQKPDGPSMRKE